MNYQEAINTYINGNIIDFKKWLKRAKKIDILNAIEYFSEQVGSRHLIINAMRNYLEK